MTNHSLATAIVVSAFVFPRPSFAAENWPDFVDQYVAQVRKTIDTTDMDG